MTTNSEATPAPLLMDPERGCLEADGLVLVGTPDEVRAIDRHAIEVIGIPGQLLMELAGQAAATRMMARVGNVAGRAVVLAGPGNNGGDGYVVARHLRDHGWKVTLIATAPPREGSDAARAAAVFEAAGGAAEPLGQKLMARHRHALSHAGLIVDALFGTGLARALPPTVTDLLDAANAAPHALRVALDVPSGLDAGSGAASPSAFEAHLTITFGLLKTGLLTGAGPALSGEVVAVPIGWPALSVAAIGARCRRPTPGWVARRLPRRDPAGHKGTSGHVAVIGGAEGTEGAALLAARGALRTGAGLVTWVARAPSLERPPEVMTFNPFPPVGDRTAGGQPPTLPARADVLVVGPGLGRGADADALLACVAADRRPRVLDADALQPDTRRLSEGRAAVLTPHPREAGRLLETSTEAIEADRVAAAEALASRFDAVVVLKGRNPVVAAPGRPPCILDITAPALSAGGTGDVLAGIIGALLAQGLPPFEAAVVGAELHGTAGREAGLGQADRGALASEIADRIPGVIAALLAGWTA